MWHTGQKRKKGEWPSGRPSRARHWIMITAIGSGMLIVSVLIVWVTSALLFNVGSTQGLRTRIQSGNIHTVPANKADQSKAQGLAQQFMHALLTHNYSTMWSLLNRDERSEWSGDKAFATYMRIRFQHYTLQGFTLGTANQPDRWVNPETMAIYTHVLELPVSLHLQPDELLRHQPLPPPEVLHPDQVFQNLPFVIQTSNQQGPLARWSVLDSGPADLEAPILPPLKPLNPSLRVPILMYHHVSDAPSKDLLDLSLTVTPLHFEEQLNYLKARGYHTITFNQMFDALYYNGPLPRHPIILTFDDGYNDVYRFALPILQEHGYSGMFYIITGKIGQEGYMRWSEVQNLLAAGMQIGSHTIHHISLGWIIIGNPKLTQEELQQSQATLQRQLGIPIQQFCYPSGEPFRNGTVLMQQRIAAMLAADGYIGATTDPGRTGIFQESAAPFDLLRIRVDGRESLASFTKVMGAILPQTGPTPVPSKTKMPT